MANFGSVNVTGDEDIESGVGGRSCVGVGRTGGTTAVDNNREGDFLSDGFEVELDRDMEGPASDSTNVPPDMAEFSPALDERRDCSDVLRRISWAGAEGLSNGVGSAISPAGVETRSLGDSVTIVALEDPEGDRGEEVLATDGSSSSGLGSVTGSSPLSVGTGCNGFIAECSSAAWLQ